MSDGANREARGQIARQHAGSALLEALVMLFMGAFYLWQGLTGISSWALYNYAVTAAVWTFVAGGVLMALVALLCAMGWDRALLVDVVVSGAVGVAFASTGAIWLANSDAMGILLVLFALMSFYSARASLLAYRSTAPEYSGTAGTNAQRQPKFEASSDPGVKEAAMSRLLRSIKGANGAPVEPPQGTSRRGPAAEAKPETPIGLPPDRVPIDDQPPEEGFLADFGKEDR